MPNNLLNPRGLSFYDDCKSDASYDMYAFMKVEMPAIVFSGSTTGLYTVNTGWTLVESYEDGGTWIEVYGYPNTVKPGKNTGAMAETVTMKNMSKAEYGELPSLGLYMTGYACGTDDQDFETAWSEIKNSGI